MTDLADFTGLVARDHGLAVVSTLRPDATISSSVVNAGVLPHPATGAQAVGFVSRGDARRLDYLRATPRVTVLLRAGWQWAAADPLRSTALAAVHALGHGVVTYSSVEDLPDAARGTLRT